MSTPRRRVVVIGIGNPWRRDDGAGAAALDVAALRLGADVVLVRADGEPGRLIDAWEDADLAVVVDAVRTGSAPGRVHHVDRLDTAKDWTAPSVGSHALGLAQAVRLGAAVGQLPRRLVVIGIEVADTTPGQGLSGVVAAALPAAAEAIVAAVASVEVGDSTPRHAEV